MANSPTINFDLVVYVESGIVRTGLLLYYDPLMLSDMYSEILSDLNTRDDTLPASDPLGAISGSTVNANAFDLEITTS